MHPATHGVLAAGASTVLGVAAHSLGGGHGLSTAHLVIVTAMAVAVGVVRAGQVRTTERRRSAGRIAVGWTGTAAALVIGQAVAHVVMSLLGHGSPLLPDARMAAWHTIALPVAVVMLVVAERLERAVGSRLADLRRLLHFRRPDVLTAVPHTSATRPATTRGRDSCAGIRGPPVGA